MKIQGESSVSTHFDEIISTRSRLREIIGEPSPLVVGKTIDHIDDVCRRFIAACPYIVVGTRAEDGLIDLSPKGDPSGFVHVIDEKTLIVPDRLGNNRLDTFENLLVHPEVGLFFMIPGFTVTLRVRGTAQIVRDQKLQTELAVNGKEPHLLMAVTVEEAFMQCAKSMARSNIWKPEKWPDLADVPSLAEAMVAHSSASVEKQEWQELIDDSYENKMY